MPLYPLLIAAAFVITVFTDSTAVVEALPRPLLVAVAAAAVLLLVAWAAVRDRHFGGLIAGELVLLLIMPLLALAFAIGAAVGLVRLARRHRRVRDLPFQTATRFLNPLSALMLGLAVFGAASAGALDPPARRATFPVGGGDLPDIYVILLDGHPRADTIRSQFGFDERPFLDEMESMGFDVAEQSHSNYVNTALTLATMFNRSQIQTLLPNPPTDVRRQFRTVTRLINEARGLDDLRSHGYEIVSIPSPFANLTPYGADRVIGSGNLTAFELALLQSGIFPMLLPDAQRTWVANDQRERIHHTFETLKALASERSARPRFVFAHVMSPHPPTLFAADGSPVEPWQCFPRNCSIWYGGQVYGDAVLAPTAEQIKWLDGIVLDTTKAMIASSQKPPVIVILSDHGNRHDQDDRDEMLRSMFMAMTPGHPGLFPDDTTPINTLPRLLNAYADAGIPFASEESYWLDMRTTEIDGLFNLEPWVP